MIAPREINSKALPYTEVIADGIKNSRALVVILSDSVNISSHISREIDLATENKLLIIPVRIEEAVPKGQLEYLLRTSQWLELYESSLEDGVFELLQLLVYASYLFEKF